MQVLKTLVAAALIAGTTVPALADTNVALNKAVTLNGTYGVGGWSGTLGSAASVTDGVYFPEMTQWDNNSVWWNGSLQVSANNSIEINLGGNYRINQFSIQADDNDTYRIEYNNGGVWQTAWNVGTVASWGVVTRNSGLMPAIVTDKLRVVSTGGDGFYSVTEVQAMGVTAVPEPEALALMIAGLGVLGLSARRRKGSQKLS